MSEYYERARDLLKLELDRLKDQGLKTYINNSEDSCYGLVTDGNSIVKIDHELMHTFSLSYSYPPQKDHGCGVSEFGSCDGKINLTKDDFSRCVSYGIQYAHKHGIRTYKDFNDYVNREGHWFKQLYVEY